MPSSHCRPAFRTAYEMLRDAFPALRQSLSPWESSVRIQPPRVMHRAISAKGNVVEHDGINPR
jgi:hypothetical protein